MRQLRCTFLFLMTICALSALTLPTLGEAAGPWKAQIVDQETKKPLEGVVVLAVWERRYTSPGGPAGGGYYDSEEVVTGPDGRFVIPARWTFTFLPFLTIIKGPSFHIFKPGYGQWRFQGSDEWLKLPSWEMEPRVKAAWAQFEGEGVVMERPPLRTPKERREFLSYASPPGEVPAARMRRYLEAIDGERVFVGFQPYRRRQ